MMAIALLTLTPQSYSPEGATAHHLCILCGGITVSDVLANMLGEAAFDIVTANIFLSVVLLGSCRMTEPYFFASGNASSADGVRSASAVRSIRSSACLWYAGFTAAAQSLGIIGSAQTDVVEALLYACEFNPSSRVRAAASAALKRLGGE